jgi:hypothetical protein
MDEGLLWCPCKGSADYILIPKELPVRRSSRALSVTKEYNGWIQLLRGESRVVVSAVSSAKQLSLVSGPYGMAFTSDTPLRMLGENE